MPRQAEPERGEGMKVSIIVPVYYGRKYIKEIMGMAERNAARIDGAAELVFVNDSPEEPIDDICISSRIGIVVVNNPKNCGIHYSRIRGLEHSHGEYILMLDQDDRICDRYLLSQLAGIGDADMIVANGCEESVQGKRILYRYGLMQWTVKHHVFYMVLGSRILSPGQCLMHRGSIPAEWSETVIKNNGADDYLLWIYMLQKRRKIRINRDMLYVHRYTGENTSDRKEQMNDSLMEVLDTARKKHALGYPSYHYIKNGAEGKQTVFRKIAGGIVKIGNEINRKPFRSN